MVLALWAMVCLYILWPPGGPGCRLAPLAGPAGPLPLKRLDASSSKRAILRLRKSGWRHRHWQNRNGDEASQQSLLHRPPAGPHWQSQQEDPAKQREWLLRVAPTAPGLRGSPCRRQLRGEFVAQSSAAAPPWCIIFLGVAPPTARPAPQRRQIHPSSENNFPAVWLQRRASVSLWSLAWEERPETAAFPPPGGSSPRRVEWGARFLELPLPTEAEKTRRLQMIRLPQRNHGSVARFHETSFKKSVDSTFPSAAHSSPHVADRRQPVAPPGPALFPWQQGRERATSYKNASHQLSE